MTGTSLSRRDLLASGSFAMLGGIGLAAGRTGTDRVRLNVGIDSPLGEQSARDVAVDIVHEFEWGALTIIADAGTRSKLVESAGIKYVERDREVQAIGWLDSGGASGGAEPTDRGEWWSGDGDDGRGGNGGNEPGRGDEEGNGRDSDNGSGADDDGSNSQSEGQVLPWGIDRVDAEVVHANGETGSGASVAIIDTGIDRAHLDLQANIGEGAVAIGATVTDTTAPGGQDDNGHGTHVAGITGAVDDIKGVVGTAPETTLHPVKVLTAAGGGLTSDVAKGVEWAADNGMDVANLSLGGPESEVLREACEKAHTAGVLLVAAAGNSGPCEDCVGFPAAYETVVAVSATTSDDSLADFSSTGPEVELAAPGQTILSTYLGNTYAPVDGTSMASPHVAGAGAQLMANGYSNTQARNKLASTAEDIGLSGNEQGNGLLDVATALGFDSSDDLSGSPVIATESSS